MGPSRPRGIRPCRSKTPADTCGEKVRGMQARFACDAVRRVLHEDGRLIGRTYENVERAAALAPGLRDFFRSCAVWRLTKMDRIFPSTGVRVRSLRFAGRRGRGTVRCVCVKPLCVTLVVLLAGFFWILFRLFHICHWRTVIYHWRDWRIIIRGQGPGLVTSLVFFS